MKRQNPAPTTHQHRRDLFDYALLFALIASASGAVPPVACATAGRLNGLLQHRTAPVGAR
ncbi:MAG TPA: hypothetical protein VMJ34_23245 [Bryobacteraceae bacterium]|nr:hypothetical protein [Bryobacteraceae bacterium]